MFGSKPTRTNETIIEQLAKKHAKLLRDGETFVAVCDGFGVSESHPDPLATGRRKPVHVPRSRDEVLHDNAVAHLRLAAVQTAIGMPEGQQFQELPGSKTGYLMAHTGVRLFIFEGMGKDYLLQAPIKGLWLQGVDHRDGMFTLIFTSGDDRVAINTRRESVDLTRAFIESFPDRRGQARIITLTDNDSMFEF